MPRKVSSSVSGISAGGKFTPDASVKLRFFRLTNYPIYGTSMMTNHNNIAHGFGICASFNNAARIRMDEDMVYLEYVGEQNGDVIYDYMPERKNADRGRISVNRETRERKLLKRSADDRSFNYHGHAWLRIDQMLDEGSLKRETYAAWY